MEDMEGGSAINSISGGDSLGGSGSEIIVRGTCFTAGWSGGEDEDKRACVKGVKRRGGVLER